MVAARKKKSTGADEEEASSPSSPQSVFVIYGDDDFLVDEEARKIISSLPPKEKSDYGLETIDGMASNQAEAAAIFKKLFESLQSQSFFATEKVVWWRGTNLLGASPTASAASVAELVSGLHDLIKKGLAPGVSLVITATDLDGRKAISKTFQKVGKVVTFKKDPYQAEENRAQALLHAQQIASKMDKKLEEEAALLLVEMSAGDTRTIHAEIEKLVAYIGDKKTIEEQDVREIGSWRPGAIVWDLPDAVGERNLNKALQLLEDLCFMGETPIALLFAVISRIRLLLLLRELRDKKLLSPTRDYPSFKRQLDQLPSWVSDSMPQDKKLNPLASHPFVLWKTFAGTEKYQRNELQKGLEILLECNERMVSSGGDPKNHLREALLKLCFASS